MTLAAIELAPRRDGQAPLASLLPTGRADLAELLARYDDARDRDLRGSDRRFVVEGERVVRRFLRSPFGCESLLLTPPAWERLRPLAHGRTSTVFVADPATMTSIAGHQHHGGCLAIGERTWWPSPTDELLARLPAAGPVRLLVAERVIQAENLGTLFRNAACLGAHGVLLDGACTDPLLRKPIRFSMGRVFDVPWAMSRDLPSDLARLRSLGFAVWAIELLAGARPLAELPRRERTAIVVGSEGHGLSPAVLAACDGTYVIPAPPPDEDGEAVSLNVGVAAGIALYELSR